MLEILRFSAVLAFFISLFSLVFLVIKTYSSQKRTLHSKPQGSILAGIIYAFGRGMAPWEKESAAKHLPTYLAGIIYHMGIFAAFFYLASLLIPFSLNTGVEFALRVFLLAGILSGVSLFIKRSVKIQIRKISCPDDFFSNMLVDMFLVLSLADSLTFGIRSILYVVAIVMLLYVPAGKIRHCFFFFYSRILFGIFYGRRGILPRIERQTRL